MFMTLTCSLSSSPSISKFISSHPSLTLLESKCTSMRDLHQIHTQIIKTGLAKDPFAISRLHNFCTNSAFGNLNYAILLFSHTQNPTPFMWNSLIRSLSKSSAPHLAISLFIDMLHSPTQPQRLTYPSLFVAYAQLCSAREGAQAHGLVVKHGLDSDRYVLNSMISMYATCGYLPEAYRLFDDCNEFDLVPYNSMIMGLAKKGLIDESRCLFDEMPSKSLISWSAMISGYVRNGKDSEALDLFHRMQCEEVGPNVHIMVSLLGACASLGALEQGNWIHEYIDKNKLECNSIVITALIDMYCRCGDLAKAIQVFDNASVKSLSTWNTVILGLAIHGHGKDAIQMFSRLESSGISPDRVSFISILTACSHCGYVDKARYYFSLMSEIYNIEPGVEHYGCLVDVLARKGLIKEAEELISTMPMKADKIMWGSLLSGSRSIRDIEIATRAAMGIFESDPRDSGGYVMLANGYANNEEFFDAASMRMAMKGKGVRKEPGSSMIEVNGCVREFVAGGILHTQAVEIFEALNGLGLNIKSAFNLFGDGK
ncbi:uncharacterized protein A4U43_C03F5540 [Asparagus officinalis]|uniref:Pentatricopeptide repeat-containing protein n=1 Tax=Asparagus officinalis TaxID=4686 RepID=A0A5P1FCP2_ASPOF|nr:pentatricopeptide repeat-containing protein At2g42920, chloroplastic-like [Asparagus officinalis]ONK74371.1 uncharacterized protein A4U43_C03F5540 [Asparagus officinalis]